MTPKQDSDAGKRRDDFEKWFRETFGPDQISGITMCGEAFDAGRASRDEEVEAARALVGTVRMIASTWVRSDDLDAALEAYEEQLNGK